MIRKRSPYKWRSGVNVLRRNTIRLAEVMLALNKLKKSCKLILFVFRFGWMSTKSTIMTGIHHLLYRVNYVSNLGLDMTLATMEMYRREKSWGRIFNASRSNGMNWPFSLWKGHQWDLQVLRQCLSWAVCAWRRPRQWGAQKYKRGQVANLTNANA